MENKEKLPNEFEQHIINLVHRITNIDEIVLLEYIKLNDYKYSIFSNLHLQGIYTKDKSHQKVFKDLYYLNRTMKIEKLYKNI